MGVVDIRIKKNLTTLVDADEFKSEPYRFKTLDVSVAAWNIPMEFMPQAHELLVHRTGIGLGFGVAARAERAPQGNAPSRECIVASSVTLKIMVCSSSAREYFGDPYLDMKYAHLDLNIVYIRDPRVLKGL